LAITNATRAKEIFKQEERTGAIALADLIIAECYLRENQKNNSQIFLNQALSIFRELSIPEYTEKAYLLQAELHISNNNLSEAQKALTASRNFAEPYNKLQTIRRSLLMAQIILMEAKVEEAESILLEALKVAESYQSLPHLIQIYEQLADLKIQERMYEQALQWHRKADSISTKNNSINTAEWLNNIQNFVISRAGKREDAQLLFQNLVNTRALAQSENRLKLLIIISIGLMISIFLFLWQMQKTNKQNKLLMEVNQAYKEQQEKTLQQKQELETTQKELQAKNEKLQIVNNDKDEIMGIVAHDLKSPLANINSLAQLIQSQELNEKEKKEYLLTIKNITEDSIQVINDLLTINRIESKTYQKQLKDFSLKEFLDNLIKSFETQASAKGIFIQLEEGYQKDGTIHSDPLTLRRILDNLVSNAIKFSPKATVVSIRVEEFPFYLKMEISDEGPGIPQKEQKNLFRKFSRASPRPTSGENSTGLGLYIAKELVHQIHGELSVQSSEGSGSTFILTIPK
jgi:signal transduction histidine kinase